MCVPGETYPVIVIDLAYCAMRPRRFLMDGREPDIVRILRHLGPEFRMTGKNCFATPSS